MTDVAPHHCRLVGQINTARRVTVIPYTDDGHLIAVSHPIPGQLARCSLPTGRKVHPRVNTITAAHHLLIGELGCHYTDLRLVAILDRTDHHDDREAVYAAQVYWLTGRPTQANGRTCALTPIPDWHTARKVKLQPARIATLLTGPHLADAAPHLPELRCPAGDPHTSGIPLVRTRAA
jgi:hypothetical protein